VKTTEMFQESDNLEPWSSVWFNALRDGDDAAIQQLWEHYFSRMVRVAQNRLQGAERSVRDEEDIALSAFSSF